MPYTDPPPPTDRLRDALEWMDRAAATIRDAQAREPWRTRFAVWDALRAQGSLLTAAGMLGDYVSDINRAELRESSNLPPRA